MLRALAVFLLLLNCAALPVWAQPRAAAPSPALQPLQTVEGISEYRLPNGLQVLLVPDDSKPTTTVNLTYRVGSRMENYGETGMAHLLEHLLFKGTPSHRNVWAEFTKRGFRANGTTWLDRTNYFASFAASEDNLQWYLSWLADAMVNSFIARADLDSEMTVVRNEMEMGENSPSRILFEKTMATMYQWHNYGKSTIGARADVENVDIPRLQAFYRTYYQPDNATLIVSGRFEPARVLQWVGKSFGAVARPKRTLPTLYTLEAAQDGERAVTLRRVGGSPLLMAAYHLPPAAHPDFAAAELLALMLGDAPSGRLHTRLVERNVAASVFGDTLGLHDPGALLLGAQLSPGQDLERARAELLAVIEGAVQQPFTAEELQRAQAKWLKAWDLQFSNPEQVGIALSDSIAQGDWRLFFLVRDRVKAAKLADVQRLAAERLIASNRTLGTYLPTEKPQRPPVPAAADLVAELKTFKPQAGVATVAAFDASPANVDRLTQRFTLPGGLQGALLPKPTRGNAVRATLTLRFGDEKSLAGSAQVASFTAALLDKGTAQLGRQQIQDRLDALRSELSIGGGPGSVTVSISSRREQLPEVLALMGQVLREPSFPPQVLEELQRQTIAGVQQRRDDPQAVLDNALARHGNPYPRGDLRYARTFDEIVADTQAVTVDQVRAFHKRFYGASQAQFAAVGDFDPAAVKQALEAAVGTWRSPTTFVRIPRPLTPLPPTRLVFQTPDKQNAVLGLRSRLPVNDTDADYPALLLGNFILGSGGDSRLWKRIREKEGLSYDVRTGIDFSSFEPNSPLEGSAIFAPANRDKVELGVREEIARVLKDGVTAQEVEAAKRALLNFRRLSRAQDERLAGTLAGNLYLNRSFAFAQQVDDAVSALTVDKVNAALRRHVKPEQFVIGVAGDFKDR